MVMTSSSERGGPPRRERDRTVSVCSPGLMSTASRSEWFTSTRTASLSHTLMLMSPAKLLTSSLVPLATLTVWSVGVSTIIEKTIYSSISCFRERRGPAQKIQFSPSRFNEMAGEIRVRRVGRERFACLRDRLVDGLEVLLDDGDGGGVELAAPLLERLLQIGDRRVVLVVRQADAEDPDRIARPGRPAAFARSALGQAREGLRDFAGRRSLVAQPVRAAGRRHQ